MESAVEPSNVITQFLHSIIEIIGRKSSADYAIVMVGNTVKKLQDIYKFLDFVDIKNTQFSEIGDMITVQSSLNAIDPIKVGKAMQELIITITQAMGTTAGFFFIKELKDKVGAQYDTTLRTMGVDLDFLQVHFELERKQTEMLRVENSDVMKRVLKALLDIMEQQTSRTVAITTVNQWLEQARMQYEFLSAITIYDIRLTLGSEEIVISNEMNTAELQRVGKAIDRCLNDIRTSLGKNDPALFLEELHKHLTIEIITKLEEMGIVFPTRQQLGNDIIFKDLITAIIDVIGKASTPTYAAFAVNCLLRKIEGKYDFLKSITLDIPSEPMKSYQINILTNLDEISESHLRRAIQKLLEEVIASLGEDLRGYFMDEFKNAMDKNSLFRIEKMGINLHMIQMRQEMLGKTYG